MITLLCCVLAIVITVALACVLTDILWYVLLIASIVLVVKAIKKISK